MLRFTYNVTHGNFKAAGQDVLTVCRDIRVVVVSTVLFALELTKCLLALLLRTIATAVAALTAVVSSCKNGLSKMDNSTPITTGEEKEEEEEELSL